LGVICDQVVVVDLRRTCTVGYGGRDFVIFDAAISKGWLTISTLISNNKNWLG